MRVRSTIRGLFPNAWLIAKREYFQWVRRRAFIVSTVVLAVVVLVLSQAPVGLQALEKGQQAKLVIVVQAKDLTIDAVGDALDHHRRLRAGRRRRAICDHRSQPTSTAPSRP